jgi:aspartate/glutamate racemase
VLILFSPSEFVTNNIFLKFSQGTMKSLSTTPRSSKNTKKYNRVLKSLLEGCKSLEKSGCKFIVIPCNTAHYWYEDLKKKIKIPIINMPKEVFTQTKKENLFWLGWI